MKSEQVYQQLRNSCLKAKEKDLKFKTGWFVHFNLENDLIGCCALGSIVDDIDQFSKLRDGEAAKFIAEKLSLSIKETSAIARGFDDFGSKLESISDLEYYNVGQKLRQEFYNDKN